MDNRLKKTMSTNELMYLRAGAETCNPRLDMVKSPSSADHKAGIPLKAYLGEAHAIQLRGQGQRGFHALSTIV